MEFGNKLISSKDRSMATWKTVSKIIVVSFFVLLVGGTIYQQIATKRDDLQYQPVGKMIDVGGYNLHMIDSHVGKVTVVIDSGAGGKTLDWCLVQPEIAKFARVITYDRAGYAWSDASPLPRTSENIVKELHTMLHNANVPAPYILVGHSFGGMNMRLFAAQYPDEVAALILVDAAHEDLYEKMPMLKPNMMLLNSVVMASYAGIFRLLDLIPMVHNRADASIEKYPGFLRSICDIQNLSTKYINAMTQESLQLEESCKQLKANGGSLGDKPLIVISAGKLDLDALGANYNAIWADLQASLVTKSLRGKQVIADNSGHNVPYDQPEIIVNAVQAMCDEQQSVK